MSHDAERERKIRFWTWTFIIVLAIVWPSYSIYRYNNPKPRAQPEPAAAYEPTATDALTTCREAVRQSLKSPRSAKFKGMFDSPLSDVSPLGRGRFRVRSWVDAQNSFGAMIRSRFDCTVDLRNERLESLSIE